MLIDARTLPPGTTIGTDLCIVGGGVAGLTLAREFMQASVRVCLLESGGREPDPATQTLDDGTNIGYPYYPLDSARARQLGGSSTRWHVALGGERVGARMRPLDPIDFEERSWVPYSGWPFGRSELEPYYRRADAACRLEPATYAVTEWEDPELRPRLSLGDDEVQTIIYKFCPREVFARDCPDEVSQAPNVTTYVYANAVELESNDAANHVRRVRVATLRGTRFDVEAKVVVLAAGGIEVPRLLLSSTMNQPAGLGNAHDLVGRFFMEHLHFWSGMVVIDDPASFGRTTLYNDVQTVHGVAVIGKLALAEPVLRREQLLNQNIQLFPRFRPDPFKYRKLDPKPRAALKGVLRGNVTRERARQVAGGWIDLVRHAGRKVRAALFGLPVKPVFVLANMSEQIPNPESRVTLGSELDALGQRRVQLDWRITPKDIDSVIRTQKIVASVLSRVGLGRPYRELLDAVPPPNTHGGYHHMGTTRMHADPRRGVVNPDCRVHGIDNLYIAGPSVFPTVGYANPVLTIVALTTRLADHLKGVMG